MKIPIIQHKDIAIISISIIITTGAIFTLIIPTMNDILTFKAEISAKKEELTTLQTEGNTIHKFLKDYNEIKRNIPELNKTTLKYGNELNFIQKLEALAEEGGVDLQIKFDTNLIQNNTTSIIYNIPLNLKADGNYLDILTLLNKLEKLNYYITTKSIRFNSLSREISIPGFPRLAPLSKEVEQNKSEIHSEINATTYWE